MNKNGLKYSAITLVAFLLLNFAFTTGCGVYRFNDISIPDSIKSVKVEFFGNRAQYVNPQLSPQVTDRFRRKIVNQTRLNNTNSDNADYNISGWISNYSVSTSGVSTTTNDQRQASMNTLTVGVHIIVNNQKAGAIKEYDVSRSFPFQASLTLQAAEAQLLDEIVRNITDEMFNRVFSEW